MHYESRRIRIVKLRRIGISDSIAEITERNGIVEITNRKITGKLHYRTKWNCSYVESCAKEFEGIF